VEASRGKKHAVKGVGDIVSTHEVGWGMEGFWEKEKFGICLRPRGFFVGLGGTLKGAFDLAGQPERRVALEGSRLDIGAIGGRVRQGWSGKRGACIFKKRERNFRWLKSNP